ncbi:beta-phosphoglucomutase-like phosphatase (HAD superfamily) [Herbihabitans rhizosphaerae]|uniref:Beta-phosphoglucomutase-like phosphatase (HAD superfamily) n=1 Tax=Herbihabitans rhizosphaerae TaxID=1872711 RepID=A0A4Q7KR72_9PSEU|nr:HAD family hydrolase [Herbihabitans rhizosphaerae]RZS37842.1 beta-phosphoglucomutase-like phosphatase (HAD superfamily) [Herbihabitans rhizosphaerae]
MTPPIDDPKALRELLANTQALLLDFDGPICSVFDGLAAHQVADQLRDTLSVPAADLPAEVRDSDDPFDVLRYAATISDDEARYVEAAFRALEVEAVQTAKPTDGAHDLIHAWTDTGRPVAIVSNNSAAAVNTYVDLHDLRDQVTHISARDSADVSRLKPSGYLVQRAQLALHANPNECTLVGDAMTDVLAARVSDACSIAYVNKPGKKGALVAAGPNAVITTMESLAPIVGIDTKS